MKIQEVLAAIDSGLFDDDLETIVTIVHERRSRKARIQASLVKPGDRVRIGAISPKALEGATGTVKGKRQSRVDVEIDKEFASRAGRFALSIMRGEPLGVPASCIAEVLR